LPLRNSPVKDEPIFQVSIEAITSFYEKNGGGIPSASSFYAFS
jgi:hypothetical protein